MLRVLRVRCSGRTDCTVASVAFSAVTFKFADASGIDVVVIADDLGNIDVCVDDDDICVDIVLSNAIRLDVR